MNFQEAYEYGKQLIFTQQCPNQASEYNNACLKALKIHTPQKLNVKRNNPTFEFVSCINCNTKLCKDHGKGFYTYFYELKRCQECGQKLEWIFDSDKN